MSGEIVEVFDLAGQMFCVDPCRSCEEALRAKGKDPDGERQRAREEGAVYKHQIPDPA